MPPRHGQSLAERATFGISFLIFAAVILATPPTKSGLGPGPVDLELAGLPLDAYPHFEYVRAFNQGSTVSIAVDPFRFPSIIDTTCDVYVTDARSAEEWKASPELRDVRGMPQTESFVCQESCDIEDFTVMLSSSETISGDAGCLGTTPSTCIGLGRPYDVVLDCNRDGTLGLGDFIDGGGKEAGLYVVHSTVLNRLSTTTIDAIDVVATNPEGNEFGIPSCLVYDYCSITDFDVCSHQNIEYPSDLYLFGEPLPLVVISHGNGHCFEWYDGAAAETTLKHTDAIIDLINSGDCPQRIGAAHQELCGRLDATRIVWIGHSRGGQGVVWARDLLAADPEHARYYGVDDIVLISSMAPTDYLIRKQLASPGDTPYHLIWGAGDKDVAGKPQPAPSDRVTLAFQILERATGPTHAVYFHGGAHGWFHEACGGAAASPVDCEFLGEPEVDLTDDDVHQFVRGYYVPLLKHYLEANVAAQDFFWRPWSRFRPGGTIDASVALEYHAGRDALGLVVDDFETNHAPDTSSCGGSVVQTVDPEWDEPELLFEGLMEDRDCHLDFIRASLQMEDPLYIPPDCSECNVMQCHCHPGWGPPDFSSDVTCRLGCGPFVARQPMNGTTRSTSGSAARGVALTWPNSRSEGGAVYGYAIPPGLSDFSGLTYLSFRAAQLPRHPNTMAEIGDLDFTVALTDRRGTTSRIRLGAYGAGIVEPYTRYGPDSAVTRCRGEQCCSPVGCHPSLSDVGWQAEFETIRIRLTDFMTHGSGLDLSDVATIRFEFGSPGSTRGRIVIDDVEVIAR
jgi:hypothetical protein